MLTIQLCRSDADAAFWAKFFVQHVSATYISHSELQTRRTTADGQWSPMLEQELLSELRICVDQVDADRALSETWNGAFTISRNGEPAGVAIVCYDRTAPAPYGVIEDIVVDATMRGEGIGTTLVDYVLADMRHAGLKRVFLESGINNQGAHSMFQKRGFEQVSIVMAKSLGEDS